jgi:DNA-binding CsgD family transcriptional regulator/PAS domain-containing protein
MKSAFEVVALAALSERELQVLAMAAAGMLDKQIGPELGISLNTLRTYWTRIRTKMGNLPRATLTAAYVAHEMRAEEPEVLGPVAHEGWVIDVESMMMMASDGINDIHKLKRGVPHPTEAYSHLYHPEDRDMARSAIHKVISGELESAHVIFRLTLESGVEVVNLLVRGVRDENGKTIRAIGYRTRALDCRPNRDPEVRMGMWTRDVRTDKLSFDEELCKIFEVDPTRPDVMEAIKNRIHPEDRDVAWGFALRAALEGKVSAQSDARIVMDDGSTAWIRSKARIEHDEKGATLITGTIAAFH